MLYPWLADYNMIYWVIYGSTDVKGTHRKKHSAIGRHCVVEGVHRRRQESHPDKQSRDAKQKIAPEISVEELASGATSRYMFITVKSVKTPKIANDFEVSWRVISDDLTQQIQLLKVMGFG